MSHPIHILLAEDEEIIAIIIQDLLGAQGYQVTACNDGLAAWNQLQAAPKAYDVVLLDRGLPGLDGMEVLRRIKAEPTLAHIPVIMETAQGDQDSIREGLSQGAYYYLTKPFQPDVMVAVVKAALQQGQELREMVDSVRRSERPLALMYNGTFRFRDLEESRLLANYLARTCPEPGRAIQGLQELLINAVEHGNLGISYEEKGDLVLQGTWQDEVQRRLHLPEYRERYVEVRFERSDESLRFTIQDQGEGFAWTDYLEFSPDRAFDLHGRGIAMASKLSLDTVEYQGRGNVVVATVNLLT